jgi:hypothetical protein
LVPVGAADAMAPCMHGLMDRKIWSADIQEGPASRARDRYRPPHGHLDLDPYAGRALIDLGQCDLRTDGVL